MEKETSQRSEQPRASTDDSLTVAPVSLVIFEVFLIWLLFFLYAGWPVPGVNEAHYVSKAKHYWDPSWCAGDLFLDSTNTHLLFYWLIGPLTLWLSLGTTTWICRAFIWLVLALAWRRLSFIAVPRPLVSVLTAGVYLMLLHHGHMAGEWVVGGAESKGLAYACVWFGLGSACRDQWRQAIVWLGLATGLHVLVGGWSIVALSVVAIAGNPRLSIGRLIPAAIVGLAIALVGLIPSLTMNWGIEQDVINQANRIQVYERLSHHLVIHRFPISFWARHLLMILAWGLAWRFGRWSPVLRRTHLFVASSVAIAAVGVLIDQSTLYFPDLAASLLRYYWYRMSDTAVPLGVSLSLFATWNSFRERQSVAADWGLVGLMLGTSGWIGAHYVTQIADLRPAADRQVALRQPDQFAAVRLEQRDWLRVCNWIRENTKKSDLVFAPRHKQTFKWYAERSEFANFKDMPQDARRVVEWWKRIQLARSLFDPAVQNERLQQLRRDYSVRFLVVERRQETRRLALTMAYPSVLDSNEHYVVYRLPPLETADSPGLPQ